MAMIEWVGRMALAGLLLSFSATVAGQDQIDESGPAKRELSGAKRTGEALWPVPPQAQWGQVITQKGSNVWKDAVFTDPKGRWQIVYPSTMTEPYGDGRTRMYRYPGQPHISCGSSVIGRVFDDLGEGAPVLAPRVLGERRDALVQKVREPSAPLANVRMVELPGPAGMAGTPVQAIMFDQRGKLLEALGVERDVVARHLLVSDGDDLLHVFCTAHPGQKSWVEKHVPQALRLTGLAREQD
ncbi:hypothetical protein [Thermomonas carbonis]|uniref:Secreted protein n=1 Tax=Thermomonas carbonis TaxID=1463158 RepID=A0A7G9SQI0_9GAMM|nr:hypothetical protein [Thermomonas carbonis]QNN70105.1 hypothetical protein H9L16_00125 [Thermomonas carbonis]GHB97793.1 hypothetical protein GCM10010080_07500 [Thermomonas carbonis]